MDDLVEYLIREGAAWVRAQRQALWPAASAVGPQLAGVYSGYFAPETLTVVRLRALPTIPNPGFYADLEKRGIQIPVDFAEMSGIAYDDTVVITQENLDPGVLAPLLFHECVHVAQYRRLGVDEFMRQYVTGWARNKFDYFSIPLERQAYALQERFEAGEHFSVEAEL